MFFAYILYSKSADKYYYGHTKNLENRLKEHNQGKVRFTKPYRPWIIHYQESFQTKSEAYKREFFFKSIDGYRYLREEKIISPK